MTGRLKDKVAVITGMSTGIGRASALLFAQEGAKVVGADINQEEGQKVIDAIRRVGGDAVFVKTDVSEAIDVKKLVEKALAYGKIHILFNNAGIEVVKKLRDTTEEEWDRAIKVNLKSVYLCCKQVIPEMVKAGGGVIINTSSVAGLVGSFSAAYSAAKGGIIALTRVLAVELARDNIRVNCICPGAIETPMLQRTLQKQGDPEQVRKERLRAYPVGRFGRPEEVAQLALFFASDESSFMTGVIAPVDGGFTAI
jgi:NAD(P)-dependent dehydrogenase (short-subunit alcohol dehydrogenase family)